MKNRVKFFNEDDYNHILKKKATRSRSLKQTDFNVGLVIDSNGYHIKVGDTVRAWIDNKTVLENCEVVEIKENGLVAIVYDEPENVGPVKLYNVPSEYTTII